MQVWLKSGIKGSRHNWVEKDPYLDQPDNLHLAGQESLFTYELTHEAELVAEGEHERAGAYAVHNLVYQTEPTPDSLNVQ